jgi:pyroglutamyl-peptidase
MKKLLITGFEPFGGEEINPSWEAVSCLPDEIGGYTLTKLRIPVVFGKAAEAVLAKGAEISPDVILCVGQAGGRTAITPELVAINLRHAKIPDNEGQQPKDEPIFPDENCAYFSTLPVRQMAEAVNALGIASQVSYSAGAYVCNDVLYTLLAHYKGRKTRVGFIHIPYASTQEKDPCLPLEQITRGLTIAIENMDGEETI